MKTRFLTPVLAACTLLLAPAARAELKVGDAAPAVSGVTETGATINLADVYAKQPYTLVYFYPKANTSGCTAQGCSLRDAYEELTRKGVAVIGVSLDKVEAQKSFKDQYHFPFTLIADPDRKVVDAFGVEVHNMGIISFANREAFLIKAGKIIWADYSAKTKEQAQDVLAVIADPKS